MMIDQATHSGEKERFVIADSLAKRKFWGSGDSAGLTWYLDAYALSTVLVDKWPGRAVVSTRSGPALVSTARKRIDLAPYSGQWVVIFNDRVAEYGADLADVVRRARQRGDLKPFVVFAEQLAEGAARIGI